jgi:tetratricopeptide (TPR) repeat protein
MASNKNWRHGTPKRGIAVVAFASVAVLALVFVLGVASASSGRGLARSTPEGALARARRLLEEGRVAEARKLYMEELGRDPNSVAGVRGLAMCARDAGDVEEAARWFERLTRLAPKDAAAHRHLALTLHRLGRDFEALSACQMAMALSDEQDPDLAKLLSQLVTTRSGLEDPLAHRMPGAGAEKTRPYAPQPQPPDPNRHLPKPKPY